MTLQKQNKGINLFVNQTIAYVAERIIPADSMRPILPVSRKKMDNQEKTTKVHMSKIIHDRALSLNISSSASECIITSTS